MCKILIYERLNGMLVNDKLDHMSETVITTEKPQMVHLVVKPSKNKEKPGSPKHNWAPNVPFPALIKHTTDGGLAVFNCVTGKHEILPAGSYYKPTPIGKSFEYKGHRYCLKDTMNGCPRYELEK